MRLVRDLKTSQMGVRCRNFHVAQKKVKIKEEACKLLYKYPKDFLMKDRLVLLYCGSEEQN